MSMHFALLVASVAAATSSPSTSTVSSPIRALVVSGANNHDWEWTTPRLKEMLEASGKFAVEITYEPGEDLARADGLSGFDVIVLDYNGPRWGDRAERAFLAAVEGGTGVAVIHAANNAFPGFVEYETLVGHCWREGTGHGRFHAFDVTVIDQDHPITRGLADLAAHPDELYHRLVHMHDAAHVVLATALSSRESGGSGAPEPMIVVKSYGRGRVFHTPLGHVWRNDERSRDSYRDPRFQDIVIRGAEWAATGEVTTPRAGRNELSGADAAAGWRLLFDGKTLEGWRGYRTESPPPGWSVDDGAIVVRAGGAGGDLMSNDAYDDFELDFEWSVAERANSGVLYRVTEEGEQSYHSGPEFQVLDDHGHALAPDDPHSAGALYDLARPQQKVLRTAGAWNQGRVRVEGWRIEHWLNGFQVLELDLAGDAGRRALKASKFTAWPAFAIARRGHVVLQDHGDEVRYRSIRIRELPR